MEMEVRKICEKLKIVARVCGGYTSLTTKDGVRIKTYNSAGVEIKELEGVVYRLAQQAGKEGAIQVGKSAIDKDAEAWAIPFGDYVVAGSNSEKYDRDRKLMQALIDALPLIAKTAGGEAVIFDAEGKRIKSVDPKGKESDKAKEIVSSAARDSIKNWKPNISPSASIHDALAVRIPITEKFGFGFNNELRVKKFKDLVDEVKKFRNAKYDLDDIISVSDKILRLKETCSYVAKGVSSILISGETGTGKELFAQTIHNQSGRRDKPFIAINCGAIPASIIESYLFGYVGGSFTGAKKEGSPGAFEQADGGTIFLDEISEMDYDLQTKLLRVIQEKEINRIGSFNPVKIDVRIISSTNRDLKKYVQSNKMRIDLYYRLNVVEIEVPPLRERREDIPVLTYHFMKKLDTVMGKYNTEISPVAIEALSKYNWPGNVRELQNCVERALNMLRAGENTICVKHLPVYILSEKPEYTFDRFKTEARTLQQYIEEAEKAAIVATLNLTKNNKRKAAKLLDISAVTLWRKMKEHGLEF